MIGTFLIESDSHDPCRNLAIEEELLVLAEEATVLYLWQNENTVVIGRNQNPWKECRTTLLEQEGGHLVRRLSGGGAVYHDLGNLNFTFLMPQSSFDLVKQEHVLLSTLQSLGLQAEISGRNDILCGGRKVSGSAFYKNGKAAYHHGTLLLDVDREKLNRYLSPTKAKLQSKGVDSVRSRVVNLKELDPSITVDALKEALIWNFRQVLGGFDEQLEPGDLHGARIEALTEKYRSWAWNYGQKLPFTLEYEDRFPWGGLEVQLQVEHGIIRQAKAYSDSINWELVPTLECCLPGCRLEPGALKDCLDRSGLPEAPDVAWLLCR